MAHRFTFRPARSDDLDALTALERRCFQSDQLSRRSFRHWIRQAHSGLILAEAEDGALAGYALVILQRGTRLARLYSIATDPRRRGQGLGEQLLDAAEDYAHQEKRLYLRLEVRRDNAAAIRLYERRGYKLFARTPDYYEDHEDALRYQKRLHYTPQGSSRLAVPWVRQSTEFTCGPACLQMALAALLRRTPDEREELLIWREATTIFMTAGHGGCHPLGLALAARRRGLNAEVYCNQRGPLFLDSVRDENKKRVIETVHGHFEEEARALAIPVHYQELTATRLDRALQNGEVAIVLISTWRLDGRKAPHWVVVSGADEECFYIHDPDPAEDQVPLDCQHVPITRDRFERMTRYGQARLRTAVIVGRPDRD
ncbi:GNAT family N-acetyltransferase/peptidase C39 family protein [Alloalcanivorax profundimaris]|uniref:GNAT family N-acetyltransferase/peptidase C39 family protein n=1 Tax=Alloalcanivorax profundimaris TaxID=2735259 RepID=UPI001889085B|nr:GNAT family N-acetyltransferase/peptidase C39 family protein [Alloalcanivorax profundimaris]MBF1802582.1 GNAT family N-acetyltransferase [Alloalcanivorax profundimaris]MCQ6263548.1 GNAT family N-acetyltransferase/peptidase C39 family protein [Alcanivorax sp. MM125-6]